MSALLPVLVSNALAASVLAMAILLVRRHVRRPPLIHALWLLVLLKLVTPPLFDVPVARFDVLAAPTEGRQPAPGFVPEAPLREVGAGGGASAFGAVPPRELPVTGPAQPAPRWRPDWAALALVTWAMGAGAVLALAAARALRFRRLLHLGAASSPALQARCDELAARLGVRRSPEVALLPGRVSPMLWSWGGRPRLVLPEGLLAGIGTGERDALLAHELAHLKRGDHRVRLLELGVVAVYWWLPTQWLVRRALREAEEDCCDAWVVWALRGAERTYADALLALVSFLSGSRIVLPPAASGAGQIRSLRRRLAMIMEATTSRSLSGWARGALLLLAAMLLPIFPSFAQEDPVRRYIRNAPERLPEVVVEVEFDDPLMEVQEEPQEAPTPKRIARIRKHVQEAKQQLERLHDRIRVLHDRGALKDAEQAELTELKDRLAQLETMLVELSMAAADAPRPRRVRLVDPEMEPQRSKRAAHRDRDRVRSTLEKVLREDPDNEIARRVLQNLEEAQHAERATARQRAADLLGGSRKRPQEEKGSESAARFEEAARLYREAMFARNAARARVDPANPLSEIARARAAAKDAEARYAALKAAAMEALLEANRLDPRGLPIEEVEEVEEVETPRDPLKAQRRMEFEKQRGDKERLTIDADRRAAALEARFRDLQARNDELRQREHDLRAQLKALEAELQALRKKRDR